MWEWWIYSFKTEYKSDSYQDMLYEETVKELYMNKSKLILLKSDWIIWSHAGKKHDCAMLHNSKSFADV